MRRSVLAWTLPLILFFLPLASQAEEPDLRVARASYVRGDVSYQRGDDEGWNGLGMNTPLMTGDSLYTSSDARLEVNLGGGNVARLDGGTQLDLVNHSWDIGQLGLSEGYLNLRARSVPETYTLEVATPIAAATILEPGLYRIEVTGGTATYSVVQGSLAVALNGQQLDVYEGESLELDGPPWPTYSYGRPPRWTSFDRWADHRDARVDRSVSSRYVHADVVGYEDLDDQGTWRRTRAYGWVWTPAGVPAGWAPYRFGSWIWQDPYGWTWVSQEPWGWAPYHYGRWVSIQNRWSWVPPLPAGYAGPATVMSIRPVYAPALVAFVGGRNWGFGISIGDPAIGWVPLAPAEPYSYPWEPAPRVTNHYTNITVTNAVTVVNYNTFARGAVQPIPMPPGLAKKAPILGCTSDVVPTRASLVAYSERNVAPKAAPRASARRPLVTHLAPPPRPLSFDEKIAQIESTGRPVASPVGTGREVGKPLRTEVVAPGGARAVSALGGDKRKELKAKSGDEARAPRWIEADHGRSEQSRESDKAQSNPPTEKTAKGSFGRGRPLSGDMSERGRMKSQSPPPANETQAPQTSPSRPAHSPAPNSKQISAPDGANDSASEEPENPPMRMRPRQPRSETQAPQTSPAPPAQSPAPRARKQTSTPGGSSDRVSDESPNRPVTMQPRQPQASTPGTASDKPNEDRGNPRKTRPNRPAPPVDQPAAPSAAPATEKAPAPAAPKEEKGKKKNPKAAEEPQQTEQKEDGN